MRESYKLQHGFFDKKYDFSQQETYSLLKRLLGCLHVVTVKQTHSNTVVRITEDNIGTAHSADAIITSMTDIGICIKTADCQSIILYNCFTNEIANIHAGWRGLMNGIIVNTVKEMSGAPKDIEVFCGPSLRICCSEFTDPYKEIDAQYHNFIQEMKHGDSVRYFVDLVGIADFQLRQAGILKKNIKREMSCTQCFTKSVDNEKIYPYFSHRRGDAGRNGSYALLASKKNKSNV